MDRRLMDIIDQSGWAVLGVGHEGAPVFAYTVGLTLHRFPELYISGVEVEASKKLLNELARRQQRAGAFDPGQITDVSGRQYRLNKLCSLANLTFVRRFFGDNDPVAPTALEVVPV